MIVESSISGNITPEQPHLSPQDVELAVKAMRGISDIEAGRDLGASPFKCSALAILDVVDHG